MMFWWRRKTPEVKEISSLQTLANQIGAERRKNPRVYLPDQAAFATLPSAFYNNQILRMRDLSAGGCCLWDPQQILGSQIGQDFSLQLRWNQGSEWITSRIISRVDHRRHVQFLNVTPALEEVLRDLIAPGVIAHHLKPVDLNQQHRQTIQAKELWTSLKGDVAIIDEDLQQIASFYIMGKAYRLLRESWPQRGDGTAVSPREFETILLFLANIPQPSPEIKVLLDRLVRLASVRPAP